MNRSRAATLLFVGIVVTAFPTLVVEGGSDSAGTAVTPGDEPGIPSVTFDHVGENLTVHSFPGQTISGTTTLPEGSNLTLVVRAASSEFVFMDSVTTTVGPNGSFSVAVNLQNVSSSPSPLAYGEVLARHDGQTIGKIGLAVVTESEPQRLTETPEGASPRLKRNVFHVERGAVASIPLSMGDAGRTTLRIDGKENDYELHFQVQDADHDGRVVVLFDTRAVATERRPVFAKYSQDRVSVASTRTRETGGQIAPGEYTITVYEYGAAGEWVYDEATLVIRRGDSTTRGGVDGSREGPTHDSDRGGSPLSDPSILGLITVAVGGLGTAAFLTFLRR